MENINTPIYRAFSEVFNKYVLGVPYFSDGRHYMLVDDFNKNNDIGTGSFPIDESTLSISFSDMLDSQGNKIFASLSKAGKGGDILINPNHEKENGLNEFIAVYHNWSIMGLWTDGSGKIGFRLAFNNKVIGIQK